MEATLSNNKRLCECGCGIEIIAGLTTQGKQRRFVSGHNGRIKEKLFCSICGTDKTFIRKSGVLKGKADWYRDDYKRPVCTKCYHTEFVTKLRYKGKFVYLKQKIRIGVCNLCRAVAPFDTPFTQIHHDEGRYDDSDLLRNTLEVCLTCHINEGRRLGQIVRY